MPENNFRLTMIDLEEDVPRMRDFFYSAYLSKPKSHRVATMLCERGISWPKLFARKFYGNLILLRELGLDEEESCEVEQALQRDFPDLLVEVAKQKSAQPMSVHGRAFDDAHSPEVAEQVEDESRTSPQLSCPEATAAPIQQVKGRAAPSAAMPAASVPIRHVKGRAAPSAAIPAASVPIRHVKGRAAPSAAIPAASVPIRQVKGRAAPSAAIPAASVPIRQVKGRAAPSAAVTRLKSASLGERSLSDVHGPVGRLPGREKRQASAAIPVKLEPSLSDLPHALRGRGRPPLSTASSDSHGRETHPSSGVTLSSHRVGAASPSSRQASSISRNRKSQNLLTILSGDGQCNINQDTLVCKGFFDDSDGPDSSDSDGSNSSDSDGSDSCDSDGSHEPELYSVGCMYPVSGKVSLYYEVAITGGELVGWASGAIKGGDGKSKGVGDDRHSWAHNGNFMLRNGSKVRETKEPFDFGPEGCIGCSIALTAEMAEMYFYLIHGYQEDGLPISKVGPFHLGEEDVARGLHPCVSLNEDQSVGFNFGSDPFRMKIPALHLPFTSHLVSENAPLSDSNVDRHHQRRCDGKRPQIVDANGVKRFHPESTEPPLTPEKAADQMRQIVERMKSKELHMHSLEEMRSRGAWKGKFLAYYFKHDRKGWILGAIDNKVTNKKEKEFFNWFCKFPNDQSRAHSLQDNLYKGPTELVDKKSIFEADDMSWVIFNSKSKGPRNKRKRSASSDAVGIVRARIDIKADADRVDPGVDHDGEESEAGGGYQQPTPRSSNSSSGSSSELHSEAYRTQEVSDIQEIF